MLLNQMGANIQYPYHDLPMFSTDDRIGFWAFLGIYDDLMEELNDSGTGDKPQNKIEINCAGKREDEK